MGGTPAAITKPANKARQSASSAVNAARNIVSNPGQAISNPVQTAASIVKPVANPLGIPAVGNMLDKIQSGAQSAVNAITSPIQKIITPEAQQASSAVNTAIDVTDPGITDVAGRKRKRASAIDQLRSGLAATMLTQPGGLLGSGANVNAPSAVAKTKLGQ